MVFCACNLDCKRTREAWDSMDQVIVKESAGISRAGKVLDQQSDHQFRLVLVLLQNVPLTHAEGLAESRQCGHG